MKLVAADGIAIWEKASIAIIAHHNVISKMEKLVAQAKDMEKYPPTRRKASSFQTTKESFQTIFDICSCNCIRNRISYKNQCICKKKVPRIEWDFWVDQSSERNMIGNVDMEIPAACELKARKYRKQAIGVRIFRRNTVQTLRGAVSTTSIIILLFVK